MLGVLVASACTNVIELSPREFPELTFRDSVEVLDAMEYSRADWERVFEEYHVLARFITDILDPAARPERLARELEVRQSDARKLGGDVLAYTDETDVVATVAQNVRYAGPPGRVAVYVLRTKGRPAVSEPEPVRSRPEPERPAEQPPPPRESPAVAVDRFVEAFNSGTLSAVAETFGESAAVYRYDRAAGEFVMAAERPGAFLDQLVRESGGTVTIQGLERIVTGRFVIQRQALSVIEADGVVERQLMETWMYRVERGKIQALWRLPAEESER